MSFWPVSVNGGRVRDKIPMRQAREKCSISRGRERYICPVLRIFAILVINKLEKFIEIKLTTLATLH